MTSCGSKFDRRRFLKAGAAAGVNGFPWIARAQASRISIGVMLPYSGVYAPLGFAIETGFRLALKEAGGHFGGREVRFVKVDDESDPAKAADNIRRLLVHDKVDLVLGTVHSGVAIEMIRATRAAGVLHIIPNAGLAAATGALCARNIFRTSFSNWQSGFAMGSVLARRSAIRKVVSLGWRYAAGEESLKGFRSAYLKGGGRVARELWLPFPAADFRTQLSMITSLRPDAVYAFLAGSAAAKFLRNYHEAGLMQRTPLFGPGFLTEGILPAVAGAAEGVETALHYGDGLETPKNKAFRLAYRESNGLRPNVYAVAGYDAGQLYEAGAKSVGGDVRQKAQMIIAMEQAKIDSPRGPMHLSRAHNPVHDQYLRKVFGNDNRIMEIAVKGLDDDPANIAACRM